MSRIGKREIIHNNYVEAPTEEASEDMKLPSLPKQEINIVVGEANANINI